MRNVFRKKARINILAFVLAGVLILASPPLFTVAQAADGFFIGASDEGAIGGSDGADDLVIGGSDGADNLAIGGSDGADDLAIGESNGADALALGLSFGIMPFSVNKTVASFADLQALVLLASDEYIVTVTNDIVFTEVIVIPSGMTIRMQGTAARTLTAAGSRHFQVSGELELNDQITLNGSGAAGGIDVVTNGKFTLNGAKITNCKAVQGGGINVGTGAAFTFNGGTISNCVAEGYGGGIAIAPTANFTMVQGAITGCAAHSGGGIAIASLTDFTMSQGTITECTAHFGGGLYIQNGSASAAFNLAGDALITDCKAIKSSGSGADDHPHGAGVFVGQGTFRMTENSQIKDCISEQHGGGIYASSDSVIEIGSGSDSPKISGCVANAKPDFSAGGGAGNGGGIHSDGNIILKSGSIEDCHASNTGGGIFLNSPAVLKMDGGMIRSCTAGNAGGVCVQESEFNMYGGSIADCEAVYYGGGVNVYNGKFSMMGDASSTPVIENCSAASAAANWWAGKGGGVYVAAGGQLTMDGAIIQNCTASVDLGNTDRTNGSGGGIYLHEDATGGVIDNSTISGCEAKYFGGGIFAKNYNKLTTTSDVLFFGNSASFYRLPADDIVNTPSIYPCTSAGSISLTAAELGARLYPLNNYDINYLSYSAIYKGNGGTDGSITEYELVYEYAPFVDDDYLQSNYYYATHTVLANDRISNGIFEFTKAPSRFGIWSNYTTHVPAETYFEEYGPGTANPVRSIYSDALLSPNGLPSLTFNALWQKDLIVKKDVIGAYGDLTRPFTISIETRPLWWDNETTHTFSLKHGESYTLTIYDDYFISVAEDSGSSTGYTVEYYDGIDTSSTFTYVALPNTNKYDAYPAITITVQNSRPSPVPTRVPSGNEVGFIAAIGLLGLISGPAGSYYRRKKHG